jgi:hypothetical protein
LSRADLSSPESVVGSVARTVLQHYPSRGILPISQSSFHGESDFPLAGSGEALSTCGSYFTVGCLNVEEHKGMNLDGVNMEGKAVLQRVKRSCHRALCPMCRDDWSDRECKKAVQRLRSFVLKGRSLKPIHVIVSVPRSDFSLPFVDLRKKTYKVLKAVHCIGGMMIYHPKRKGYGDSWYFSPHFHIIGYGWIVDVRATYVHSGYVVKNVGIRKTVEGTIFYQLSHCGVSPKHHTVTWFGALSYGKLHVVYREKDDRLCPLCGNKFRRVMWIGKGACPLPDVEGVVFFDESSNWVRWRVEYG